MTTDFAVGTTLVCIETGLPSMLILDQTYVVIRDLGESSRGQIIQVDNGAVTYANKFRSK